MLLLKALDDALWLPFFQHGWRRETGVGTGAAAHASSESVFTRRVRTGKQRKAAVGVTRRVKTTECKGKDKTEHFQFGVSIKQQQGLGRQSFC